MAFCSHKMGLMFACVMDQHITRLNNAQSINARCVVHLPGLPLNMRALGSCLQDKGLTMRTSRGCAQVQTAFYFKYATAYVNPAFPA